MCYNQMRAQNIDSPVGQIGKEYIMLSADEARSIELFRRLTPVQREELLAWISEIPFSHPEPSVDPASFGEDTQ